MEMTFCTEQLNIVFMLKSIHPKLIWKSIQWLTKCLCSLFMFYIETQIGKIIWTALESGMTEEKAGGA